MKIIFLQMTRIIIILAVLAAVVQTDCTAQNLFGVNGYYSMNSISVDSSGMKRKIFAEPGFGGGFVYKHMELRNLIGFQAEVNYDYVGFRIEPTDSTYYKQNIKYITVPLLAHVNIGKYSVKAIFAIGPYFNVLVDYSKPRHNIDNIDSSIVSRTHSGSYNKLSYGLYGEAGIAICTKYGVFEILGRGSVGMSKMKDLGKLSLMNYMTSRNVAVGVSYLVPFGKGEKYYTKREKIKKDADEVEGDVDIDINIPDENSEPETTEPETPAEEENWEDRREN